MSLPTSFAQQTTNPPWEDILLWSGILLGAVLIGVIVVAIMRRTLTSGESKSAEAGFTLHELRDLHKQGRITDAEYERAKAAIIAHARAAPHGADEDPAERAVRELRSRMRTADKSADQNGGENGPSAPKPQEREGESG